MKTFAYLQRSSGAGFTRRRRHLAAALALLGMLAGPVWASGTSYKHEYIMRGQILEMETGSVVVCVGKSDGAEVGQVLNVVRHERIKGPAKIPGHRYKKVDVGTVRITTLFEDHYATVEVVKGAPKVNDTVELKR